MDTDLNTWRLLLLLIWKWSNIHINRIITFPNVVSARNYIPLQFLIYFFFKLILETVTLPFPNAASSLELWSERHMKQIVFLFLFILFFSWSNRAVNNWTGTLLLRLSPLFLVIFRFTFDSVYELNKFI